jgi:hypothetical protein
MPPNYAIFARFASLALRPIVSSLNESTWYNYGIGFPGGGHWLEIFNDPAAFRAAAVSQQRLRNHRGGDFHCMTKLPVRPG